MTQDKETLREAVARAIAETEGFDPAMDCIEGWYETAAAAIATMFERLRTPSHPMCGAGAKAIYEGLGSQGCWQAMLAAFQQENSDGRFTEREEMPETSRKWKYLYRTGKAVAQRARGVC